MDNYVLLELLEKKIGYKFKDKNLLFTAITHSSYTNDDKNNSGENYERMEFFGDSILQFSVSEILYKNKDIQTEGKLTKTRAILVCEETLSKCAETLGLSKYIIMSNGGIYSGGRERPSILADVVESIIAAIYLDGGIEQSKLFVSRILKKYIPLAIRGTLHKDFKSTLQEYIQASSRTKLEYVLSKQDGPVHDRIFEYSLFLDGIHYGQGVGKTIKEAQQNAAKEALGKLNVDFS